MGPIDPTPAALLDLLPEWELALRAEDKTPGTTEAYLGDTRRYLDWCTAAHAAPMLRTSLQTWMAHLLEAGSAPGTVLARKQSVKRFADWLLATGQVHGHPFLGVKGARPASPHRARALRGRAARPDPPAPTRSTDPTRSCTTAATKP